MRTLKFVHNFYCKQNSYLERVREIKNCTCGSPNNSVFHFLPLSVHHKWNDQLASCL